MEKVRRFPGRSVVALALAVAVGGIAAGCGGGSDSGAGPATGDDLTAFATTVRDCVNGKGYTAALYDSTPFGVEVPTGAVKVTGLAQADKATIWLFNSAADASASRSLITLAAEDTPRGRLVDRAVVDFNNVPSEQEATTITGCLTTP